MERLGFGGFDVERDWEFLFLAHRETYFLTFGEEILDEYFVKELEWERTKGTGAYLGDELVGICDVEVRNFAGQDYGWVHFFYLAAKYRGKGLSRQLVEHAEQFCRLNRLDNLALRVGAGNKRAIKFYEDCGFVRDSKFDAPCEVGYRKEV